MSFSSEVKTELAGHVAKSIHCRVAELSAIVSMCGEKLLREPDDSIVMKKFALLIKCLYGIEEITDENFKRILLAVKMWDEENDVPAVSDVVNTLLIQKTCCRRAYIRGAFIAGGSISDPNKSYHFEIVCRSMAQAGELSGVINSFGMDAKIVERKHHFVVYLKEGEQIVDILNVMEAHMALMNLENVRILKEMRNTVNRKVNCETANISKTVNAAVKQLGDIELIRDTAGLDSLPDNLKEMAEVRLLYPEATLGELGTYLDPPVGKSGVNHRLRKISAIADGLR
jgi:hypothetical protein